MIFDGKGFAKEIEQEVKDRVQKSGKKIKIVSILVGDDPASELYTKLKKQAAERVGINFEIVKIDSQKLQVESLLSEIARIGERDDVAGVMVQLPLPENFKGSTPKVIEVIPLDKDVDGLRWEESKIVPATVRAVIAILDKIAESQIKNSQILKLGKFVVVGARGAVGRPLVHFLKQRGVEVSEVEWDSPEPTRMIHQGEVVISCVGKAGVVTGEMAQDGIIAIDVGSPKGDMTEEVYQKASVALAVPGGVGPVTIASLMQNALDIF